MLVDFFKQGRRETSNREIFGVCDDTVGRNKKPAYIDFKDKTKWIAEIHNPNRRIVDFYAIDCCVVWYLPNGNTAKSCDAMLSYNERRNIVFMELKNRQPSYKQWKIKAESQLKSTIDCFRKSHAIDGVSIRAYICNKQALFDVGEEEYLEKFKDETGVTLRVYREIEVA